MVTDENGSDVLIVIPHDHRGWLRSAVVPLALVWLGGWLVGAIGTVAEMSAGKGNIGTVVWLAVRLVLGAAVARFAYRMFACRRLYF